MITLFGRLYAPDDRGLCTVTVDGGTIASIEPFDPTDGALPPSGALGGPDARILPGLLDIQINGAFGDDFADAGADMDRICRDMTRFGVTGFAPTVVTSAPVAYGRALANLRRPSRPGEAGVLGVHLEGPFISPRHPGTHDPAQLRHPSIEEASSWLEAGDVAYVTLAPELPGAVDLVRFLRERGVRVSLGHTDATWADAASAVEAGASQITHVFNAMRPFRHRDPGIAGYALASPVMAGFIADGNHLAFETIRVLARSKGADELFLVTDALAGLGMPPGRYVLAGREYISDGTCGRLPDGTLSGSLLPLNRALRNLVDRVGLDAATAVRLATLNPARALGLEATHGRVEVGRRADVTLVGADWEVLATVAGGELAYEASAEASGAAPVQGAAR